MKNPTKKKTEFQIGKHKNKSRVFVLFVMNETINKQTKHKIERNPIEIKETNLCASNKNRNFDIRAIQKIKL